MKLKKFKKLLLMSQDEVWDYVLDSIPKEQYDVVKSDNNYILVSHKVTSAPKCLLTSHLDTVDTHYDRIITASDLVVSNNILSVKESSINVLGGDDRAGVAIMIDLINSDMGHNYDYAFFCDEEVGGLGSSQFVKDFKELNYTCFVSLDRRGNDEVADYGYTNSNLRNIFTSRGYTSVNGSFSDCVNLSQESGIACVNLSVGYNYEHSSMEVQDFTTLNKVYNFLTNETVAMELSMEQYDAEEEDWYGISKGTKVPDPKLCECCGQHLPLYDEEGYEVCEYCLGIWNIR